ncbi:MAG: hypothetical protein IJA36_10130 [Lachnospiraceae bacterium]|nr:hypothetical protein [Lachnospiraceae bacterium]
MKRVGIITLLLLASSLTLSACQAVPDEVKEAQKGYQDNKQIESAEVAYCNVEELEKSVEEALKLQPDNMILPKTVDFSQIEEVDTLTLEFQGDFLKNKEQVAEAFGCTGSDWENVTIDTAGYETWSLDHNQEEYFINVGDNGFTAAILPNVYEGFFEEDKTQVKKVYRLGRTADMQEECVLSGETTTIAEQMEFVNNWFQNTWKWKEERLDYQVRTVILREDEKNGEMLSMEVGKKYQGILLDNCGGEMDIDTINGETKLLNIGTGFYIAQTEKNTIDYFTSGQGAFDIKEAVKQETFIDLPSAVRLVEKELSGFQKVNISEIQIIYMLQPVYENENESEDYSAPGKQVKGTPVYRFYIDRTYEDIGFF